MAKMAIEKEVPKGCVECPFCDDVIRGDKFTEHSLVCKELKAEVAHDSFEDYFADSFEDYFADSEALVAAQVGKRNGEMSNYGKNQESPMG